ncbi:MAG: DUF58 domain-containing protein [Verrucomicrobiales bacterium]|nr:DUF58 domain-containing protein [Verrucomicrobiales bacterium]
MPTLSADLSSISSRGQSYADFFKLPLAHQVWRGQVGDFQGSGIGSSLDFQDHRSYMPGDDPRHINWQAFARTGQYSMKLYREEVRPLVDVVLDVSESMKIDDDKWKRALELFYFCIHAALKAGASLSTSVVKGENHIHFRNDMIHNPQWIEQAEQLPATSAACPPELQSVPLRAQSMRIFISDLLFHDSPQTTLVALAREQGRAMLMAPFCVSEERPDWEGNYEFVEIEDSSIHPHRIERHLLERYHDTYHRHFDLWKSLATKHGALMARVPAEPDFQSSLQYEALAAKVIEF